MSSSFVTTVFSFSSQSTMAYLLVGNTILKYTDYRIITSWGKIITFLGKVITVLGKVITFGG